MRSSTSTFARTSRRAIINPSSSNGSTSSSTTINTRRNVSTRSRTPHDPDSTASARIYTPRKEFLYRSYLDLLDKNQAVILFQPNNLSSAELGKIRRAVKSVPVTKNMSEQYEATEGEEDVTTQVAATFTVARTGLLSSVIRSLPPSSISAGTTSQLASLLSGPVALLTVPTLSPPYLKSLFASMNKSLAFRPPTINPAGTHPTSSRLVLLGALLEKTTLLSAPEVVQLVQTVPELDQLRAQLVGLLEMPARQLLGVSQQAGGGGLVRTLMGLEEGLKEKEGGGEQGV